MKKLLTRAVSMLMCALVLAVSLAPAASASPTSPALSAQSLEIVEEIAVQLPRAMLKLTSHVVSAYREQARELFSDPSEFHRADTAIVNGKEVSLISLSGAFALLTSIRSKTNALTAATLYINCLVETLISTISDYLSFGDSIGNVDDYVSENFYSGNGDFISENPDGAWSLGYAQEILTPDDLAEKNYYMGGFAVANKIVDKFDDIKVRTVCLDDGSGRGKTVFAVVDAIGLSNRDVREIRSRLADFAAANNIVSINVSVTHVHSSIDTQGIWAIFGKWKENPLNILLTLLSAYLDGVESVSGVDPDFMESVYEKTALSVKNACTEMTRGKLFFSTLDRPEYFDYRKDPLDYMTSINKLCFLPDRADATPTIIANFGAHPELVGLETGDNPGNILSADYVPYIEQVVNAAGYNFQFIQGAVGSMITTSNGASDDGLSVVRYERAVRYGQELGYVLLGMGKTYEQCLEQVVDFERERADLNALGEENADSYTPWYKDWKYVEEKEVKPVLNIALNEIILAADNPVVELIGKAGLTTNLLLTDDDGGVYTVTEVGYLELGDDIKILMSPGETVPEMIIGGASLGAEYSVSSTEFEYAPLNEILDTELLVFDVMNDSIGYIMPDNDYGIIVFRYYRETVGQHTNGLLFSMGQSTASTLIKSFLDLAL